VAPYRAAYAYSWRRTAIVWVGFFRSPTRPNSRRFRSAARLYAYLCSMGIVIVRAELPDPRTTNAQDTTLIQVLSGGRPGARDSSDGPYVPSLTEVAQYRAHLVPLAVVARLLTQRTVQAERNAER
jgi:hypothetical protein